MHQNFSIITSLGLEDKLEGVQEKLDPTGISRTAEILFKNNTSILSSDFICCITLTYSKRFSQSWGTHSSRTFKTNLALEGVVAVPATFSFQRIYFYHYLHFYLKLNQ